MTKKEALTLLEKYNQGLATETEAALLQYWFVHEASRKEESFNQQDYLDISKQMWYKIEQKTNPVRRSLWSRATAAAIFVVLSTAIYLYNAKYPYNAKQKNSDSQLIVNIKPSGKAILTLANGQKISLTEARNGVLAEQPGVKITKTADGQLVYAASDQNKASESLNYNTIEIPKGQQYQLNLPDGTKVWLNAASSLKFPASFANLKERKVELSGEAYFEVKHNARQPFRVQTTGQVVEDIGTSFNVNSYRDERIIETTLVEGSIKVIDPSTQSAKTIHPGEQASSSVNHSILVRDADVQKVTAWKNGEFLFKDDDLPSILRQVSRWYNVEVVYQGAVPASKFTGQASRNITLDQMMDIMKASGVQVNLKNRTLFIQP